MNTLINRQFISDHEIQAITDEARNMEAGRRIEELKAISNIMQAMENLVIQCRSYDGFKDIETYAENKLRLLKRVMHAKIHV